MSKALNLAWIGRFLSVELPHGKEIKLYFIYIYIYIYIHLFTKTLLFQKYISYISINTEERLKQGGQTLHQPRGVTITYNFCF